MFCLDTPERIKTLVADRAADAGTWAQGGYRSPEAWLSQTTGVSYGEGGGHVGGIGEAGRGAGARRSTALG
jgi:hypothetical protein